MSRSSGSSVSLYLRKRNVERDDGSVISLPYQKLSSKSSLQIATSCISDITSSPIRRKTTSRLGRPPGEEIPVASSTRQPIKSSSSTPISSVKTAPMKELQKIITDLKKENFDLKLRLFHLEEMRTDVQQENHQLAVDLQERDNQLRRMTEKRIRHVGTQTTLSVDIPMPPSSTAYHTPTFETSPEAFGLPYPHHNHNTTHTSAGESLECMMNAFQSVRIASPKSDSSLSIPDELDRLQGWLNEIVDANSHISPLPDDHHISFS